MGNALRLLYGQGCSPEPPTTTKTGGVAGDQPLDHHGVSLSTGVSTLAHHLDHIEITSQVPEVVSSETAQSNWYRKLSKARESKTLPNTPEEASRLIIHALQGHQTLHTEGLLSFYGLPLPRSLVENETPPVSKGFKFELHTLPVNARAVGDGDGVTVYVRTSEIQESSCVLQEVIMADFERNKARAKRNYKKADALHKQIIDAGYGVLYIDNEEILARKYRIRIRGIDAPKNPMPYGKEAKDELENILIGNPLKILVFNEDCYGRFVGDVYCNGIFVQESMLKKGLAWHFTAYDKRKQLAEWEKEARAERVGLWVSSDPEKPWEWRKNHPQHGY